MQTRVEPVVPGTGKQRVVSAISQEDVIAFAGSDDVVIGRSVAEVGHDHGVGVVDPFAVYIGPFSADHVPSSKVITEAGADFIVTSVSVRTVGIVELFAQRAAIAALVAVDDLVIAGRANKSNIAIRIGVRHHTLLHPEIKFGCRPRRDSLTADYGGLGGGYKLWFR